MVNFRQQVLKPLGSYIGVFRAIDALLSLSRNRTSEQKREHETAASNTGGRKCNTRASYFCPLPF